MVARGAGAAGPVLLACRQWDPLGLARRLPSLGVGAWRSAPLLLWQVQCPVRVCAALAAGSGGLGRYLVLCLSRFPLPAPRVTRCVWRAVPSGCPLPSLAGTPFHAVCAFRELGPVALLVVPACPLRVCVLAFPRRPLPPPPWVVWRVHPARSRHSALVGRFHLVRAPPRVLSWSLAPSGVLRGGAVRSRLPPTWLGVVGVAEGCPQGGCLPLFRGASRVRRSPSPDCPPTGRAVGDRYPRAVGAGVWVWGPYTVPLACTPCRGCVPRGWWGAVPLSGLGLCAPRGAGPWRSCAGGPGGGVAGGPCAVPLVCAAGGGLWGGGSLCLVPSLCLPWAGNKAGVTGVVLSMGGVAPHTTPVRARPPSLGAICAASWRVGAGSLVPRGSCGGRRLGQGGGPRSVSSLGRGERGPSPLPRGVGAGAPAACGLVGWPAGGGGCAAASLLPLWVAARGSPPSPPSCSRRTPPRRARAVRVAGLPWGGGG